jgi:hypothetical protein
LPGPYMYGQSHRVSAMLLCTWPYASLINHGHNFINWTIVNGSYLTLAMTG